MIKFLHKFVFTWLTILTWLDVIGVLASLAFGALYCFIAYGSNSQAVLVSPLITFCAWSVISIVAGFFTWILQALNLVMLAYYTRPQAWVTENTEKPTPAPEVKSIKNSAYNKSIYS